MPGGDDRDRRGAPHDPAGDQGRAARAGPAGDRLRDPARFRAGRAGRARACTKWRRSRTRSGSISTARRRPRRAASGGGRRSRGRWRMDPDVLLLDEPTNHLDLAGIEWLEDWLSPLQGRVHRDQPRPHLPDPADALVLVARPRRARRHEVGYGGFEAWTEQVYAEEARNADRLDAQAEARGALAGARGDGAAAAQPGAARQTARDARGAGGDAGAGGDGASSGCRPTTCGPRW